ncbi:glycosyltransferase [Rhodothermus sp. AH-315-K08]|nr:glycosyltransferase [Rhodothermus sp. AH-315-K08]
MITRASRRVLVLAYYFPPMGLSGVQRTAKFVKYLPDHGWSPVVLTVTEGGYFAFDESLLDELKTRDIQIVRTPSVDPTRLFSRRSQVSLPGERARSGLSTLSQWLMIPDNKLGWGIHAYRAGSRLLEEVDFDAIISSAPPYSSHLIAARLARSYGMPLVLDYRDDWLENPRHVYPTRFHRWLHARQERRVAGVTDAVVTINPVIASALRSRHDAPVSVIPQGFDPEDYVIPDGDEGESGSSARLEFIYTGVFYDRQTPIPFLNGLHRLVCEEPALRSRLRATFVGLFPKSGLAAVERLGLGDVVQILPYLSQGEAMARIQRADVPWLIVGAGPGQDQISTGKLFAYIGAGKPILGLVPEGAARDTLESYPCGWIAHPDEPGEIDFALRQIVRLWLEAGLPQATEAAMDPYSRPALAGHLAAVLNRVSS